MPREGWNEVQEAAWGGNLHKITQIIETFLKKSDQPGQSLKQSLKDGQSVRNNYGFEKNYTEGQSYGVQVHSNIYLGNSSGNNNSTSSNNNTPTTNQQILNELTSPSFLATNALGYMEGGESIYSVCDKNSHHEDEQDNLKVLLNAQTPNAQEAALHLVCFNK